jgi:nucleoside-diphosphate-sugar epimerase
MKILITGGNGNIAKMIKNYICFSLEHNIKSPSRDELNVLNFNELSNFLIDKEFDILIHTAISGGNRTKEETGEITHNNLLMMENLLYFSNKFKMIINFDSGAIYDRKTDIYNRKEEDLFTIPTDYYGFSKYLIYKRSQSFANIFNLRIFNIFHINEELRRFIKSCFLAKNNNSKVTIFEDKYFDFFYEDDFMLILKHYIDNVDNQSILEKTVNICYDKKYKLSEIAKMILKDESKIIILNDKSTYNYSGNNELLEKMNIPIIGLEKGLEKYSQKIIL